MRTVSYYSYKIFMKTFIFKLRTPSIIPFHQVIISTRNTDDASSSHDLRVSTTEAQLLTLLVVFEALESGQPLEDRHHY